MTHISSLFGNKQDNLKSHNVIYFWHLKTLIYSLDMKLRELFIYPSFLSRNSMYFEHAQFPTFWLYNSLKIFDHFIHPNPYFVSANDYFLAITIPYFISSNSLTRIRAPDYFFCHSEFPIFSSKKSIKTSSYG